MLFWAITYFTLAGLLMLFQLIILLLILLRSTIRDTGDIMPFLLGLIFLFICFNLLLYMSFNWARRYFTYRRLIALATPGTAAPAYPLVAFTTLLLTILFPVTLLVTLASLSHHSSLLISLRHSLPALVLALILLINLRTLYLLSRVRRLDNSPPSPPS